MNRKLIIMVGLLLLACAGCGSSEPKDFREQPEEHIAPTEDSGEAAGEDMADEEGEKPEDGGDTQQVSEEVDKTGTWPQLLYAGGGQVAEITADGEVWIFSEKVGDITDDGEIWVEGVKEGDLTSDGEVWMAGDKIGDITSNGEIWLNSDQIGDIEADGTIWLEGDLFGSTEGGRPEYAAIVFFYGFYSQFLN